MNGKEMQIRHFTGLLALITITCFIRCDYISAGNREMVESDIKELDTINKDAVKSMSGLPRNAGIDLKAEVTYKRGEPRFKILRKNIRETREENFDFVPVTPSNININQSDSKDINATEGGK